MIKRSDTKRIKVLDIPYDHESTKYKMRNTCGTTYKAKLLRIMEDAWNPLSFIGKHEECLNLDEPLTKDLNKTRRDG